MTELEFSIDELRTLADMACNGALTEQDAAQLERLLHGNVKAQQFYLARVSFDTWLRWKFASEIQEPTPPPAAPALGFAGALWHGTVGYFSSGWPVAYLVATVIFGIGLLIGSLVHVSRARADCQAIRPSPGQLRGSSQRLAVRRPDHRHGRLQVGAWDRGQGPEASEIPIPNPQSLVSLGDTVRPGLRPDGNHLRHRGEGHLAGAGDV